MDYEFSFEEANALLHRNWFFCDEDIDELLWLLTEEVFQQVYEKRYEYPFCVSLALRMHEPIKTKALDFTDEMMEELLENEEIERITKWRNERDAFVPSPRPRGELDDEYDELKSKIEKLKKGFRSNRISELQTQLDELANKIETLDRYWGDSQWVLFSKSVYEF